MGEHACVGYGLREDDAMLFQFAFATPHHHLSLSLRTEPTNPTPQKMSKPSQRPSLLTRRLSVAGSASLTRSIPAETEDPSTLLYYSCNVGDVSAVATILDENPNLDTNAKRGRLGATPLFAASLRGNTGSIELLLAVQGTDVNLQRDDGTTPLIIAAQEGHYEAIKLLLQAPKIQINKAFRGRSPLFMASYKNHPKVVRHLVHKGADCNQQEVDGELTPLMIACSKGYDNVVDILLSASTIDVNMCDAKGQTALFIACLHGHSEVLQALSVQRDIQGNLTRSADHSSPLQVACMMSHSSDIIATILATNGTDVHHVNDDGHTAIYYAEEGDVHDVVLMLSLLGGKSKRKREEEDDLCQVCEIQ